MSDAGSDQEPKPQPKFSGGPPKPPKITARGVEDGSPKNPEPIMNLATATMQARRQMELLKSIRGSRLLALNILEADLDISVVWISKLLEQLDPEPRESATFWLRTIRDYRRNNPHFETGDREIREQAKKVLDEV